MAAFLPSLPRGLLGTLTSSHLALHQGILHCLLLTLHGGRLSGLHAWYKLQKHASNGSSTTCTRGCTGASCLRNEESTSSTLDFGLADMNYEHSRTAGRLRELRTVAGVAGSCVCCRANHRHAAPSAPRVSAGPRLLGRTSYPRAALAAAVGAPAVAIAVPALEVVVVPQLASVTTC